MHPLIFQLIGALGGTIPAFELEPGRPADRPLLVKAWLLIYTILDQSNHAANHAGIARDPAMIDVIADSFMDFVSSHGQSA